MISRWLAIVVLGVACQNQSAPKAPPPPSSEPSAGSSATSSSNHGPNEPVASPATSDRPGTGSTPANPDVSPKAPPPIPAGGAQDRAADAAAWFDARNYVAPALVTYSRTNKLVVFPACRGGEGPGEHCSIAALDGKSKTVPLPVDVAWSSAGTSKPSDRAAKVADIARALTKLDTVRLARQPWTGAAPIDVAGFGVVTWSPGTKQMKVARGSATTDATVEWGDKGGPVAIYSAPDAPVAVAQLRVNPTSGGTEGYVVVIQFVVLARP